MWHILAAYFVGTAAGVILFKTYVKEQIIVATLDNLVEGGFVKSYKDHEGLIQFMRIEDIEEMERSLCRVEELIREAERKEENEKDDTP